jgi:DNA-binding response OmpR family regulator
MRLSGSLLLIDDDPETLSLLGGTLRADDHEAIEASTAGEGRRHLAERAFDVVVVGHTLLHAGGVDLMRHIAEDIASCERPHVLMITCQPAVDSAVAAMKLDALDYLQKPFAPEHLLARIRHALELRQLRRQRQYLISERNSRFNQYCIIGTSRAMQQVIERAELVARSNSTVLIVGETGTGKEMVARAVHHRSAQQDVPLIKVNCAAVPEGLLESDRIELIVGDAVRLVRELEGPFDLVFVDAWKHDYATYYEAVLDKLADHGVIVVDNVLWHGEVVNHDTDDANAVALRAFVALVHEDERVDNALLTVGDGLLLAWKRSPRTG